MRPLVTFAEGLLSFLSPCVLPLVPLYVTYFASVRRRHTLLTAVCFTTGFTVVFVLLGALSGTLGGLLTRYRTAVNVTCGVLIALYGLSLFDVFHLPAPRVKGREFATLSGAFVFGMTFSLLLTPCAGAYLAAALTLAADAMSAKEGVLLLFVYSLGLAVPFWLSAVLTDRLSAVTSALLRRAEELKRFGGACLILAGVLIAFTGSALPLF